jgi:hypothetical protein
MSFKWIGKLVKWVLQHPEVIELGESIVRSALKKKDQEDDLTVERFIAEMRAEEALAKQRLADDVAARTGKTPRRRRAA